jgi:glycosyltransferase involved in cell wall biosynthesis
MNAPVVSVVMAAYNAEAFLAEAINSILAQTFTDFEFIIVDDGSTDDTGELLACYAAREPRISVVSNHTNLGLARSLNCGLEAARGRYIARQDADDVSLPHRLEKQVAFMDNHAEVGVCCSWVKEIGLAAGTRRYYSDDAELRSALLFRCPLAHPAVIMRRDILARHDLRYDESLRQSQDYQLWARTAPHVRFASIAEPLVLYRVHSRSTTQQRQDQQHADAARVRRGLLEEMGGAFTEEEFQLHEAIGSRAFSCSRNFVRRAEAWFCKLRETNREQHAYPEPAFSRVLADEWHYVCDRNSYRGFMEGLWSLKSYFASPLSLRRPRTWRNWLKTACWLRHGPLVPRVGVSNEVLEALSSGGQEQILLYAAPYGFGGAERYLAGLCRYLNRGRRKPVALAITDDIHGLRMLRGIDPGTPKGPVRRFRKAWYPLWYLAHRRLFTAARGPVIFNQGLPRTALHAMRIALDCRADVYCLVHSRGEQSELNSHWLRVAKENYSRCRRIMTVSESTRRCLIEDFDLAPDKVLCIGSFVTRHEEGPGAESQGDIRRRLLAQEPGTLLLMLTRLSREKGVDVAIEAMARLTVDANVRLAILGEGPQESELKALVERLHVGDRVTFEGFKENAASYLSACDAVIISSRREEMPLSMLEAMSLGKPVIAARVGGIPEVLSDRENGLLVAPEDPQRLASAMAELAENSAMAKALGLAARETVANGFGVEQAVQRIMAVLNNDSAAVLRPQGSQEVE